MYQFQMYQCINQYINVFMYRFIDVTMYQCINSKDKKNTHIKIYYIIEEMSCQHYQPAYNYLHKFV